MEKAGMRQAKERVGEEVCYTAFHIKLPFLELDYTASAKCRYRHFAPLNGQSSSKKGTFDEKRYIKAMIRSCAKAVENLDRKKRPAGRTCWEKAMQERCGFRRAQARGEIITVVKRRIPLPLGMGRKPHVLLFS
jgi:hypothetical protein